MIYLDHNSTSPPLPEVIEAMGLALADHWGNPSSQHWMGQDARAMLTAARHQVATLVHAVGTDVVFTSGGTEAANQVLLGGEALFRPRHLVTSSIEHPCVLSAADTLESAGWRVTRLPVDGQGCVNPSDVRAAVASDTAMISVMAANNDTGVLQPIAEIAEIARTEGIPFHTDAVQTVGRWPLDLKAWGVDFATLSGHKFHGPKGCGAVVFGSNRRPGALLRGGEQEGGLRAGTENVPAIVGMGVAAQAANQRLATEAGRMRLLRDRLENLLREACPDAVTHGAGAERLPNTLNLAFPGIRASALVLRLDLEGIAVSTTSACSSQAHRPPHTLVAMGIPPSLALASVRFSLGHGNTQADIDATADAIARLLPELRKS